VKATPILVTAEQRASLERIERAATSEQREVLRSRIVLCAAEGLGNAEVGRHLRIERKTVGKWRGRFAAKGLDGLKDAPRSGRPSVADGVVRCQVLAVACSFSQSALEKSSSAPEALKREMKEILRRFSGSDEEYARLERAVDEIAQAIPRAPRAEEAPARTGWTIATLTQAILEAEIAKLSQSTVWRILNQNDLQPHRRRMWLHSPDPQFKEKVTEICQLYLRPKPDSTVISVDEKTGMQILKRIHPGRPAAPGRLARREFEYERLGTMCLFAGFEVHTGKVFGRLREGRTAWDLRCYLNELARWRPCGEIHLVLDNLNIHLGERMTEFNREQGGRFHFHYTPIHASWVNQVECFFSIFDRRVLRDGDFSCVEDFAWKARTFLERWNEREAHPFRWTFTGYPLQIGLQRAA
jgi:transposase